MVCRTPFAPFVSALSEVMMSEMQIISVVKTSQDIEFQSTLHVYDASCTFYGHVWIRRPTTRDYCDHVSFSCDGHPSFCSVPSSSNSPYVCPPLKLNHWLAVRAHSMHMMVRWLRFWRWFGFDFLVLLNISLPNILRMVPKISAEMERFNDYDLIESFWSIQWVR